MFVVCSFIIGNLTATDENLNDFILKHELLYIFFYNLDYLKLVTFYISLNKARQMLLLNENSIFVVNKDYIFCTYLDTIFIIP